MIKKGETLPPPLRLEPEVLDPQAETLPIELGTACGLNKWLQVRISGGGKVFFLILSPKKILAHPEI